MTPSAMRRLLFALSLTACLLRPTLARAEKDIEWGYANWLPMVEQVFFPGQGLMADRFGYQMVMRWDGSLVVETRDGSNLAWYVTGGPLPGGYLVLGITGNLELFNWADQLVWQSNTAQRLGAYGSLYLWDDGNVQLHATYPPYGNWDNGQHWGTRTGPYASWDTLTATAVYINTDSPGNDTRCFGMGAARWSWCGYYCMSDNNQVKGSCAGWTYVPTGVRAPNPVCCLKSSIPLNSQYQPAGAGQTWGMVTGLVW